MLRQLYKKLNHPNTEIYGHTIIYIHDGADSMIGYLMISQSDLLAWDHTNSYNNIPLADPDLITKARDHIDHIVKQSKTNKS